MVNCCLRSWISWCWSCRVHFAQLKTDFWCLHKCSQLKHPKKQWEVSHLSFMSFVKHTDLKMGKRKKFCEGCYLYQYTAIIAQKCLLSISWLEATAPHGVNINKVLLSWVLQHTQTSRVNSVWRQHQHWFAECKRGFYLLFCHEVASYLLSSCPLWSTSSVCSIGTDFSCLCLRYIVCWTWKKIKWR